MNEIIYCVKKPNKASITLNHKYTSILSGLSKMNGINVVVYLILILTLLEIFCNAWEMNQNLEDTTLGNQHSSIAHRLLKQSMKKRSRCFPDGHDCRSGYECCAGLDCGYHGSHNNYPHVCCHIRPIHRASKINPCI